MEHQPIPMPSCDECDCLAHRAAEIEVQGEDYDVAFLCKKHYADLVIQEWSQPYHDRGWAIIGTHLLADTTDDGTIIPEHAFVSIENPTATVPVDAITEVVE